MDSKLLTVQTFGAGFSKTIFGALTSHLESGKVFGPYYFHMSVMEYQKRGLPHAHVIVKFKNAGPDVLNQNGLVGVGTVA